jgi:hypothetical protein
MSLIVKAAVAACMLSFSANALACFVQGKVTCFSAGTPVAGAVVTVQDPEGVVTSTTTGADGTYYLTLSGFAGTYVATIDLTPVDPNGTVVSPSASVSFDLGGDVWSATVDWGVSVAGCGTKKACWLTGGGAKFDTILGINAAQKGPKVSFGGNVNPSCSPDPGQGGQWSHVDHDLKLFFQGTAIVVDDCGNVSDIPPGSTSPVTPFNFIEFHGTGSLKGIAGNKTSKAEVCFVARAEDRNEPGSNGQNDGAFKDRYFIRVLDCATSAQLLVLEQTVGAGDPVTITDGNMQIHISSCP